MTCVGDAPSTWAGWASGGARDVTYVGDQWEDAWRVNVWTMRATVRVCIMCVCVELTTSNCTTFSRALRSFVWHGHRHRSSLVHKYASRVAMARRRFLAVAMKYLVPTEELS